MLRKVAIITALMTLAIAVPALAVSPVPPEKPRWTTDSSNGCRVWDRAPQRDQTVTWSGPCPGGVAQGQGVLQWFIKDTPTHRFEGELHEGKMQGRGILIHVWPIAHRYEGEFFDGEKHGRGVTLTLKSKILPDGFRYEGEYQNGWPHGRGILTTADGDLIYDGEQRFGVMHGRGVWKARNGDRYEGEWWRGFAHGQGTKTDRDGRTHTGIWTKGCLREGQNWITVGITADKCGRD
jgi:hypothetical protein